MEMRPVAAAAGLGGRWAEAAVPTFVILGATAADIASASGRWCSPAACWGSRTPRTVGTRELGEGER